MPARREDSLQSPSGVAKSPKGDNQYRSPRRPSFCSCKRKQNRVKGDGFPLDEPLSVACSAGYERCQGIVRTAHRYAPKVAAGASAPTPSPSPVAGEGPSGQIAACSTHRLDSVTSCNRFAGTKLKCACGSLSASSNPAPGMRSVSGRGVPTRWVFSAEP